MHDLMKIKELLENLRFQIWLRDIPSPTVPEYVEHHKSIQELLHVADSVLSQVDDIILGMEDDGK